MQHQEVEASKTSGFVPLELHMNSNSKREQKPLSKQRQCSSVFGRNGPVL